MEATVHKDPREGWKAKTVVDLGENRELHITTNKASNGRLVTRASVHTRDGMFLTHRFGLWGSGGDFSQWMEATKTRCTEGAIRTQHSRNLERVEDVIALARAHYSVEGVAA